MNENILFFSLYQSIALFSEMLVEQKVASCYIMISVVIAVVPLPDMLQIGEDI